MYKLIKPLWVMVLPVMLVACGGEQQQAAPVANLQDDYPQITDRAIYIKAHSEERAQKQWPNYEEKFSFGREASAEEIAGWDIDIRPDGQGLPVGSGSVEDGEGLYDDKCAMCHGSFGEGEGRWPALSGGFDSLGTHEPAKTVGSYWPYLSTVWDYVHRAMPYNAPQTLEDDEVYAIVAYILYLNDMVDDDFVLTHENLASIEMANKDGFFVDDRPDANNTRCMENCKDPASIKLVDTISGITPTGHFKEDESYGAGEVVREGKTAVELTAKAELSDLAKAGEATYKQACAVCHDAGLAGAPTLSDQDDWQARLETRNLDGVFNSAINGFSGDKGMMPPKGGQSQLADDAVQNAVRFMLESSGVTF